MADNEHDAERAEADGENTSGSQSSDPLRRRPRIGYTAAILVALLGFTIAVQIRSNDEAGLDTARTEDLVRILSDLDSQRSRLRDDIAELNQDRDELASGSRGRQAALDRARALADSVAILAGTIGAQGPGLVLTFSPGDSPIEPHVMLDAVQELRGAGAEAMQLDGPNGASVRIVASSYFAEQGGALLVDDVSVSAPYVLRVIGDPDTMSTALNIPGGVADTVQKDGGTVKVGQPESVSVETLAKVRTPQYAEPVD